MIKKIVLLFFTYIFLISCYSKPQHHQKNEKTEPTFNYEGDLTFYSDFAEIPIEIEIADTPAEQMKGLMYRSFLEENQGMLFVFDDEVERSFWMKNTILPLDIIFADSQKIIVSIYENAEPYSLDQIPSEKPAKYVIEVNAGFCKTHNIKIGDSIKIN